MFNIPLAGLLVASATGLPFVAPPPVPKNTCIVRLFEAGIPAATGMVQAYAEFDKFDQAIIIESKILLYTVVVDAKGNRTLTPLLNWEKSFKNGMRAGDQLELFNGIPKGTKAAAHFNVTLDPAWKKGDTDNVQAWSSDFTVP